MKSIEGKLGKLLLACLDAQRLLWNKKENCLACWEDLHLIYLTLNRWVWIKNAVTRCSPMWLDVRSSVVIKIRRTGRSLFIITLFWANGPNLAWTERFARPCIDLEQFRSCKSWTPSNPRAACSHLPLNWLNRLWDLTMANSWY